MIGHLFDVTIVASTEQEWYFVVSIQQSRSPKNCS